MLRVSAWIHSLQKGAADALLRDLYGADDRLLQERKDAYLSLLNAFAAQFGENNEVIISRSPGRLNLMGRHVDHRGGHVNPIALNLEVLVAAQLRNDDQVVVYNVDSDFKPKNFLIHQEIPERKIQDLQDWDRWTFERFQERVELGTSRDWDNYIKAAVVYFQDLCRASNGDFRKKFPGMNLMVSGNIPHSAGLSSSSALFVATAEAVLALNEVDDIPAGEFIEHCGRGEWFVGTRGGSGDHAAMKYGKRGMISHIGFHPSTVEHVPFPPDYRVVICNSWDEAHKAGGARSVFNQRVACYEIGLLILQETFPEIASKVERLRDVNVRHLGVTLDKIYEYLLCLPDDATREDLVAVLPEKHHARIEELFSKHDEPDRGYGIRRVCLYGLAECERSRICFDLLSRGDVNAFGELMRISHNGDRVAHHDADGNGVPWDASASDAFMNGLIRGARENDDATVALYRQPGGYECSTPRVDELAGLSLMAEGVIGAQLSGAGLGGCVMVLVHQDAVSGLLRHLDDNYYSKHQLPSGMHVCVPVEGCGVVPEL